MRRYNNSPSHFVTLKVDNSELLAKVHDVQDKISERFPEHRAMMANLARAHVTLLALYLYDQASLDQAVGAIREARPVLAKAFPERGPRLHFKGVAAFDGGRVLHCPADADDSSADIAALGQLARDLREFLAPRLPPSAFDAPRDFSAHIVLAKSRLRRRRRPEPAVTIPAEAYEAFANTYIGEQVFAKLELVTTLLQPAVSEPYVTVAHVDFAGCPQTPDTEEREVLTFAQRPAAVAPSGPGPAAAAASAAATSDGVMMSAADLQELREWRAFGQALQKLVLGTGDAALLGMMPHQQGGGAGAARDPRKRRGRRFRRDRSGYGAAASQSAAAAAPAESGDQAPAAPQEQQ